MAKQIKELDPRLRRLVRSAGDRRRLDRDRRGGIVSAAPTPAAGPPAFTKRVLVQLAEGRIPRGFDDAGWTEIVPDIYTASIPVERLAELAARPEVHYVEAGRSLHPALDTSLPETRADDVQQGSPGQPGLRGRGVVVGIVDLGFDFTLDDFRNPDGSTRVAFLWDQGLTPQAGEHSPAGFAYGVEYDRARIDAALASPNPFGVVRHRPAPGSHGTHVAGIAAGNGRSAGGAFAVGRFVGAAPEATLVLVHPATEANLGTFADSVRVAEAIAYVYARAQELGLPCVINMSLGQNGGSHDGETVVERAIDGLLTTPGRAFVVAAGNEHVWRGHASGDLAAGATRTLQWKVGGGMPVPGGATGTGADVTNNELEVWYSSRDLFELRISGPAGDQSAAILPGSTETLTLSGNEVFVDSERFNRLNGDARIYVEVSPGNANQVTAGVWRLELRAVESRNGHFDAWIERDARRSVNNFADQSFFVGTDFDALKTLGTPASGRRSLAVANYFHVSQAVEASSGRGGTRDGRNKPELAAPGTNVLSSGAMGNRPNPGLPGAVFPVRVRMTGTSMAAPHVAGIGALLLEKAPTLTAEQLRKVLIASASVPAGASVFDPSWGYGRVDAAAALELVDKWIA